MSVCVSVMALTTANVDPDWHKSKLKKYVNRKIVFIFALIEILYYYVDVQNTAFTACLPAVHKGPDSSFLYTTFIPLSGVAHYLLLSTADKN